MKKYYLNKWKFSFHHLLALLMGFALLVGCNDDDGETPEPLEEVTAVFTSSASGLEVTFVNASLNATDYNWDFGDENSSTDENPVHTYATPGSYTVTLTASNAEFTDMTSGTVVTQNGGPLASKIVGKEWIPAHGDVFCYSQGPIGDAGTANFNDQGGATANFGWGDTEGRGWRILSDRPSLENDEYTFNADGTMDVNFNGDWWKEFSLTGPGEEGDYTIADGMLTNADGVDLTPFSDPSDWTFVIDEDEEIITTSGLGAHILNPRLAYHATEDPVLTPQSSVWYDIIRVVEVEGAADTLVIYAASESLGFGHYITMHSYESPDDIPPLYVPPVLPPQYETSVASTTLNHTFLAEDGGGVGIFSVDGPYAVDYAANIGGENCTKFTRPIGDQFGNFLIRAGTAGGDESEIDFTGGETMVSLDVYLPSTNDYSAELDNVVRIRFIDESRLGGDFWMEYIQMEEADVSEDQWVTLTFDFTTLLSDAAALETPNIPDGVMIEFSEVGTATTSEAVMYVKDFKFIVP